MMKNKFLLAALSFPMVFAACTQEDLVEMSNSSVNKGGDIKVALNVAREGDITMGSRATWDGEALTWLPEDKISMYRLGTETVGNALTGKSNAIFVSNTEGTSFTSESLIYLGANSVVYPANLKHFNEQEVVITVNDVQTATTVNDVPYISNELNIQDKKISANTPGYHQPVYAPMKMAANVVELTLDVDNTEALEKYGFDITSVELHATGAFTTTSNLVRTSTASKTQGAFTPEGETTAINTITNSLWTEPTGEVAHTKSVLTSKAIKKNENGTYTVRFVVLPTDVTTMTDANSMIVVNTTCGTITLKTVYGTGEEAEVIKEGAVLKDGAANEDPEKQVSIAAAIKKFVSSIEMTYETSSFMGENVGRRLPRTIAVDASKAVLNGSKVYDDGDIIRYVNLYTDMKKAQSTDDKYMNLIMSIEDADAPATWNKLTKAAVDAINGKNPTTDGTTTYYVTLSADESVNAVELTTVGAVYDVPAYDGKNLPLILGAGEWTMDDTFNANDKFSKLQSNGTLTINGTTDEDGDQNVMSENVELNGVLNIGGNGIVSVDNGFTAATASTINIKAGQMFNLAENMMPGQLSGTINVANTGKLTATEGKTVYLNSTIDNKGTIATEGIVAGFYNAGVINMSHERAITYLQGNEAGVVNMSYRDDEVVVQNTDLQGKIVYNWNATIDGKTVDFDAEIDRYNYLVFGDVDVLTLENVNENISLEFTGTTYLESYNKIIGDLTVAKTGDLTIESKRSLTANNVYLYGKLTIGGLITYKQNYEALTKPFTTGSGAIVAADGIVADLAVSGDTYTINSKAGLLKFAEMVNEGNSFTQKTVMLNCDIDLAGAEWEPISSTSDKIFQGTFDGNNKTISNLYVNKAENAGFFGKIYKNNGWVATIKNLKIVNANVIAEHYAGVILGYGFDVKLQNCTVDGGSVKVNIGTSEEGSDFGDKAGGIVGTMQSSKAEKNIIENCTVKNLEIIGYRDLGGIVGYTKSNVNNCNVQNVSIIVDSSDNYKNFEEESDYTIGDYAGNKYTGVTLTGNSGSVNVEF